MRNRHLNRRQFLGRSVQLLAGASVLTPSLSLARKIEARELSFFHTHTGQSLDVIYRIAGHYDPVALKKVNRHLRDFRTMEIHPIDPELLDLLYKIRHQTGGGTYEVISGYRSPKTNTMLRSRSKGVARQSLHMKGMAIDVRLAGVKTRELWDLVRSLRQGGAGYYAKSDFVHIDTGRVRFW